MNRLKQIMKEVKDKKLKGKEALDYAMNRTLEIKVKENLPMVKENEMTTMKMTIKLRDKLKSLGKKGDTYEDIIWRLIQK